jgi:hypothetical protein
MATSNSKQRLFEVMGKVDKSFKPKLNEDAFNDAGEPLMTHNQYRDYSEPAEPEYDDSRNDYEEEQTPNSVVKTIEKHFNTILETYNSREYRFLTKGTADLNIYFKNNVIYADAIVDGSENNFPEQNIDELDVNELIQFFEPYRQYILSGAEAESQMNNIYKQNAADARYASQERAATGGLGENISGAQQTINPKYTHFAITQDTNDIVNGWDYSDIEPAELRKFKKDYFFTDLSDMGIDPHNINVVTTSYLKRTGINPFDINNWKQ